MSSYHNVESEGFTNIFVHDRSCLHDPAVYPDPFEFQPERFMRNGKYVAEARDPSDFVFGFGRRYVPLVCLTEVYSDPHTRAGSVLVGILLSTHSSSMLLLPFMSSTYLLLSGRMACRRN